MSQYDGESRTSKLNTSESIVTLRLILLRERPEFDLPPPRPTKDLSDTFPGVRASHLSCSLEARRVGVGLTRHCYHLHLLPSLPAPPASAPLSCAHVTSSTHTVQVAFAQLWMRSRVDARTRRLNHLGPTVSTTQSGVCTRGQMIPSEVKIKLHPLASNRSTRAPNFLHLPAY